MVDTFGKMGAKRGERCSNNGFRNRFTTPCCYAELDGKANSCPECGAPIVCFVQMEPVSVCMIADKDDFDVGEED